MANLYYCTDGTRVSQAAIDRRYTASLQKKYADVGAQGTVICEACGQQPSAHSDHTIARARCKEIHKTELIWDPRNYVRSCVLCHKQWENFKAGDWCLHLNASDRLAFMQEHDPEGFTIRVELTRASLSLNATT